MSIANTLNIAKVCVSLTIQAIEQGLEKDLLLPLKIDISQQVVNDINTDDSSNADLTAMSNQLFAMCGGYAFEAQRVLNLGGGGIVATTPAGSGLTPFPISHVVTVGESGSMTISSTAWVGLEDINQVVINQSVFQVGYQFTFNPLSGVFDFSLTGYTLQTGDIITSFGFMPV
jgi:hypothetical protein